MLSFGIFFRSNHLLNPEMSGAWLRTDVGAYPSAIDRRLNTPM
jgi:hypothetical protein